MKDGWWNKVKFFISNASDVIRRNLPGAAHAIKQDDKSGAMS
jgi:hypothetical protein